MPITIGTYRDPHASIRSDRRLNPRLIAAMRGLYRDDVAEYDDLKSLERIDIRIHPRAGRHLQRSSAGYAQLISHPPPVHVQVEKRPVRDVRVPRTKGAIPCIGIIVVNAHVTANDAR